MKNAISANGIRGLFNSISPAITSKDISNISKYNRLVSVEGVSSQTAWYRTMMSSSKTAQSEFDSQNAEFSNNAMFWLEDLDFYKNSDKYIQTAIQKLVSTVDWSKYDTENLDYEGVKRILQDSILTPFQVACDDPNTKALLNSALSELFTMDTTDMSVGDIKSQVDSYINTIAASIGEDPVSIKARLGFDDSEEQPLINNVKEKLQDDFDSRVGELTLEELHIAAEQVEIPEGTLLSWDELIAKIKEVQDSTSNIENPISLPYVEY